MRQKLTVSELVFLTILPALLLMLSACYQIATELLHLPPYLMMCISGLCAVTACLLWGASLCGRMLRPAALRSMLLLAALGVMG